MVKPAKDEYTDQEATRRMNRALKRALDTPPQPHKASPVKQRASKTGRIAARKQGAKR